MDITTRFRGSALVGAAAMVLVAAMALLGIRVSTGALDQDWEVTAVFDRVGQGLDGFSDVRVRGVAVGSVESVTLDDDGRPVVRMALDPDVRLPTTTTAAVVALSIFGPKYVDLDLGAGEGVGPWLGAGAVIEQTTGPTELQDMLTRVHEVLTSFDTADLTTVLAVSAQVADHLAPAAGPIIEASTTLVGVAAARTDEGTALLRDLARITAELDGAGSQLAAIGRDLHEVLPDVTARSDDLADSLDSLTRASGDVAALLEAHPDAVSDMADGLLGTLLPPLAITSGNLDTVPMLVDVLGAFFGTLGEVIFIDGPAAQLLGAIEMVIPVMNPCALSSRANCADANR